jgi:hypothetical protein
MSTFDAPRWFEPLNMLGISRVVASTQLWHLRCQGNRIRLLTGVEIDGATVLEPLVRFDEFESGAASLKASHRISARPA